MASIYRPPTDNRRYSVNNPFLSGIGEQHYSTDELDIIDTSSFNSTDSLMSIPERYSNNPFADALTPTSTGSRNNSSTHVNVQRPRAVPPAAPASRPVATHRRSAEEGIVAPAVAPPSYEEAAGTEAAKREYPREKQQSSSASRPPQQGRTREHRSRSEGEHRSSSHRHRSDRERESSGSHRHHHHHRDGRERSSKHHRSKKQQQTDKPENLDTIDKLDVTGFFGGGAFHHDGPFDACTPHRNKNTKAAPVMAFPADGPNSTIRGMGPVHTKEQQMDIVFGHADRADDMYAYTAPISRSKSQPQPVVSAGSPPNTQYTSLNRAQSVKRNVSPPTDNTYSNGILVNDSRAPPPTQQAPILKHDPSVVAFDTNAKAAPVHGSTTLGLGSSTFLDGAPATKTAIQEASHKSELTRNKSLVNRMRKKSAEVSRSDHFYDSDSSPAPASSSGGNSLLRRVKSLKVSRK